MLYVVSFPLIGATSKCILSWTQLIQMKRQEGHKAFKVMISNCQSLGELPDENNDAYELIEQKFVQDGVIFDTFLLADVLNQVAYGTAFESAKDPEARQYLTLQDPSEVLTVYAQTHRAASLNASNYDYYHPNADVIARLTTFYENHIELLPPQLPVRFIAQDQHVFKPSQTLVGRAPEIDTDYGKTIQNVVTMCGLEANFISKIDFIKILNGNSEAMECFGKRVNSGRSMGFFPKAEATPKILLRVLFDYDDCIMHRDCISQISKEILERKKRSKFTYWDKFLKICLSHLIRLNLNLINELCKTISEQGFQGLEIGVGSARQSIRCDQLKDASYTSSIFLTGSIFPSVLALQNEFKSKLDIPVNISPLLLSDIEQQKSLGTAFQVALKALHERSSIWEVDKIQSIYQTYNDFFIETPDNSKLLIVYANAHDAAALNELTQIMLIDDLRREVLIPLHGFFTEHSDYLPKGTVLRLKFYNGTSMITYDTIIGTGPIDYHYQQTIIAIIKHMNETIDSTFRKYFGVLTHLKKHPDLLSRIRQEMHTDASEEIKFG